MRSLTYSRYYNPKNKRANKTEASFLPQAVISLRGALAESRELQLEGLCFIWENR